MPPAAELVADKGYDSKALRDWLAERGTTAVIPPSKNRKVQYHYEQDRLQGTSKNAQMSPNRGSGRHPASGFWRSVAPERLILSG